MSQIVYEILGFGGAVIIAFAHIPQILRIFKTKDSDGISVFAWGLWVVADCMVFVYSISIQDRVFIFLNGTNLLFASIILFSTLFYRWRKHN